MAHHSHGQAQYLRHLSPQIFTESLLCVRYIRSTGNTVVTKTETLSLEVYILKWEMGERWGRGGEEEEKNKMTAQMDK